MNISEVCKKLSELCPHNLALFEYNGLLVEGDDQRRVKKLAFTLGYSKKSIIKAIENNIDFLVVHNAPEKLMPYKTRYFEDIAKLVAQSSLTVYRLHLPLDFVKGGIIDQLCQLMEFEAKPVTLSYQDQEITGGVYFADVNMTMDQVIGGVMLLKPSAIRVVTGGKQKIKKIAITSGDGCKPEFLLQMKPDVFICGLLNQESIRIANDLGITLIEATSYATESHPLDRFVSRNKHVFTNVSVSFLDIKNDVEDVIIQ